MPNPTPSMPPINNDQLADKCEAWLQAGGASNIVDAFEAGYRASEAVADERVREALAGVLEALEAGHDALASEAVDYHRTMAGYRPHIHQAMDAEVASVKAVLERVRASLAAQKGTT